jgi:hypothetical protein
MNAMKLNINIEARGPYETSASYKAEGQTLKEAEEQLRLEALRHLQTQYDDMGMDHAVKSIERDGVMGFLFDLRYSFSIGYHPAKSF